jgi:hypothetical protein
MGPKPLLRLTGLSFGSHSDGFGLALSLALPQRYCGSARCPFDRRCLARKACFGMVLWRCRRLHADLASDRAGADYFRVAGDILDGGSGGPESRRVAAALSWETLQWWPPSSSRETPCEGSIAAGPRWPKVNTCFLAESMRTAMTQENGRSGCMGGGRSGR